MTGERTGAPGEWRDRCRGTLVGAVVGDALGAPFEGHTGPLTVRQVDRIGAASVGATPSVLHYTDDTAMTIAVADSLLFCGGLDEDHLVQTFAVVYERDPNRGYGAGTASLLRRVGAGAHWRTAAGEQFGGQGSHGNGAAMRVAPIGLLAVGDPAAAADLARRSARVTHAHPLAVEGAAVQAAAVAMVAARPSTEPVPGPQLVARLHQLARDHELRAALEPVVELARHGTPDQIARTLGTGVAALEAVPTALCAFLRHPDSFPEAVRFAIGLGGDTDTIASMTGALAGAHLGHTAIPQEWDQRVEGTVRLRELADRLVRWLSSER